MLFEDKLIAALDPNGFRPLSIGKWSTERWLFHLKPVLLRLLVLEWIRDLKPGEIVIIDDKGIQYDSYTDDTQLAICFYRYHLFCRHCSNDS